MSTIFDEAAMRRALEEILPAGETLTAGIHAVGLEVTVLQQWRNAILSGEELLPSAAGPTLEVSRSKAARFDLYLGISERSLLLAECEPNRWLRKVSEIPNAEHPAEVLPQPLPLAGTGCFRFPLGELERCTLKKVWMGAINCTVALKNGSFLKLQLLKLGGLGGGMPHHTAHREAILACLSRYGA